jgi:hypothetical protein
MAEFSGDFADAGTALYQAAAAVGHESVMAKQLCRCIGRESAQSHGRRSKQSQKHKDTGVRC